VNLLERILGTKRLEIARRSAERPVAALLETAPEVRLPRLSDALAGDSLHVIAEVKYQSPSHGLFACQDTPARVSRSYAQGGAAALSILTDETYFKGKLEFLDEVRDIMGRDWAFSDEDRDSEEAHHEPWRRRRLPLLRKDFIVDRYQVVEARAHGASAFLLIVACLSAGRLADLREYGAELGLEALVEVHDLFELDSALDSGARVIGVNNRNLRDFSVNIETAFQIARRLEGESSLTLVAESGLSTRSQLVELKDAGFSGFLIGTAFMETSSPGHALAELLNGGK
jgi:indole-3-glycerol phosphate synthase